MKMLSLLTIIFLASFLSIISFALSCSDLSENQCNQLQKEGCIWSGAACTGLYSPSCVPPSCYYIDSDYQGTVTPDGTPGKPLKTLSDGFTKISGKDGFLIIINKLENATVAVTKSSTISSNITIKPFFEDRRCTIDFTQFTGFFLTHLTIKSSSLKLERINLGLQFQGSGGATIFSVSSGGSLSFENVEVHNTSTAEYLINLVKTSKSTFSMVDCKFTNTTATFDSSSSSTMIWKNVHGSGQNVLANSLNSIKQMRVEDCFFTGSLGSIFLTANSGLEVMLKNSTFKDLDYAPMILIYSTVKLMVEDCIFDRLFTMGLKIFSFEQRSNLYGVQSVIRNTSFTNIAVQVSIFYLDGKKANLSLVNVTMKNITQKPEQKISNSNAAEALTMPRGVCCSSIRSSQLFVESSHFSDIDAHCFGLRDTIFTLKSSTFDNSQLESETEIKREDVSSLDERSGISWITIQGTSYSQGIYKIFIEDNKFIKNGLISKSGGAIRFTGIQLSQIIIAGNEFIGNKAYYGGAIYSENVFVTTILLNNNLFVDNSAYHGGAIYKNDTRFFDPLSEISVSIANSQFIGNKAVKNGGALYLNWDSLWISDTEFISNSAVNGGALYFINFDDEKYGGMKNVSFIENSASNAGGAMKLFFKSSQLKIAGGVIFENNFDTKQQAINQGRPSYYLLSFYDIRIMNELTNYGNLEDLVKDPKLTRLALTVNTSEVTEKQTEMKHKSGNELSQILHVQVFDNENNVVDYIDDEEIALDMIASQNNISNYPASLVSSPVKFTISNGQFFTKSAIKMHGEPKTTATLRFSNIEGSSDFIQDSGLTQLSDLQVRFVDCEEGDIFDIHTRSCLTCPAGSFSFENPYKTSHCTQCPPEIDCYGGNLVGPKSGHWMGNPKSLMAIKCPYPSACMGGYVDYEYFPNGKCLYPHQGNLCNQCAPKFAKFGSLTKCEDCKNNVEYYLKFGLFLLPQVAVILGLYKLNEKQNENNTFYVNIMKILINFFQINSIITNFNLEWSSLTTNFVHVVNSILPVNHDGFSIDCFISLVLPDNQNHIFIKLIVTFFQPFFLWGLSILAYSSILLCSSSDLNDVKKKLQAAIGHLFTISAFLVQTNVILTCLELFSCQNLSSPEDPKYFLTSNSDLRCWTGSHLIWSFGVALPLLLIWAVLLPVILFLKTRKYSKLPCWQPFFYQGLEKKRFYWEFIMLFVKTLIIILFTVLTVIQTEIQVLCTFFVCISLSVLFLTLRPYTDPRLHGLGFFSLVTLTLVSYIGFFSFVDNWMGIQMTIGSVSLVVANCGLFTLAAFYIIKEYTRTKGLGLPENNQVVEAQPQTEAVRLSRTEGEEQHPKQQTIQDVVIKSEDDLPEVSNELNQEMKIGKTIHHSQKESIDNFSIMQTSGSALLSPLQSPRMSSRLLSPLCSSPAKARQILLSPVGQENSVAKGDGIQQQPVKPKKVNLTRFNMKQFLLNEIEVKNTETEKPMTEMTELTPSIRTQVKIESENLLTSSCKFKKMNTKNNEEGTSMNL